MILADLRMLYMKNMFNGCSNLTTLDLNPIGVSKIALNAGAYDDEKEDTFYAMCSRCKNLKCVDISSWSNKNKDLFLKYYKSYIENGLKVIIAPAIKQ